MNIAIVTGASGNLGQAVVKKFMAEGFFVIGTVILNDPVPMNFPRASFEKVVVDLLNEEDSEKFVDSDSGQNVEASSVVPSTIDTEADRKVISNADFTGWVKAEQIADVIYYYSSEAASALREPVIKVYNNA